MDKKEPKILKVYEKRKIFYAISCLLIVTFAVLTIAIKLNVAIEFKGGTILTYSYTGDLKSEDIEKTVGDTVSDKCTITLGEDTSSKSKTIKIQFSSKEGISDDKQNSIKTALTEKYKDNEVKLLESTDVAASNGLDFFLKCLVACAFAAISAGVFSVVALIHDMCMVYGCFVICRFNINANFMAVLLTILGYSINATIIIYDRIRENEKLVGSKYELDQLVNLSITQTMGRSIHTTVTTVLAMATVCVVCLIAGVSSIISFAFPLIIGMIAGVYSSNCIAPTLWVMWEKHKAKKGKGKAAKKEKKSQRR